MNEPRNELCDWNNLPAKRMPKLAGVVTKTYERKIISAHRKNQVNPEVFYS